MRKLFFLVGYFATTPVLLIVCISLFAYLTAIKNPNFLFLSLSSPFSSPVAYAALPSTQPQIEGAINAGDSRTEKVQSFFTNYDSLLANYAQNFVTAADAYGIDYRLLPSIAMQESIGCKREIPGTFNCFGWGITKKQTTHFENYADAIDSISRQLAKNYIGKGLNTPEEIQKVYNPSNTSDWISKVKFFMEQL